MRWLVGTTCALALTAALVALAIVLLGRRRGFPTDTRLLLATVLALMGLKAGGDALQWLGNWANVDTFTDTTQVLIPVFWAFLAHSLLQNASRAALEETERKNRLLLENVSRGIFFKDQKSVYVTANQAFAELLDTTAEQISEQTDADLFGAELAERYLAEDQRVLGTQESLTFLSVLRTPRGERVLEVVKTPVIDEEGEVAGLLGMVTDITEHRQAEEALGSTEAELRSVLRHIGDRVFLKNRDLRFTFANERFAKDLCLEPQQLVGKTDLDVFDPQHAQLFRREDEQVLKGGEPVVTEMTRYDPATDRHRLQRWTKVPICNGREDAVALLAVGRWTEDQRRAEQMLSQWASLSMASDDAVVGLTAEGHIVSWNAGAERIYGYTPGQMQGQPFWCLCPPAEQNSLKELVLSVASGELVRQQETVHLSRDRVPIEVSMSMTPLRGADGGIIGVSVIARDVTARKQAERQLRERERALSTLLSNLPGAAYRCRTDRHWTMEFMSEGCLEITGYRPRQIVDNREVAYGELIVPEDRESVWREVEMALQDDRPFRMTYRITRANGEPRWVWEQGRGVRNDRGDLVALEGFITDITEQRRAEKRLRRSEQRFRLLAETALDGIGICRWDPETNARRLIFCNDRFVEMSGYSRSELEQAEDLNELISFDAGPQERQRTREHLKQGLPCTGTASWRRPDGRENTYAWSATSVRVGNTYHLYCVDRDITDQQRAERALRKSKERYRRTLDALSDAVLVLDRNLRIRIANRALRQWCQQLGVKHRLVGTPFREAFPFLPEERESGLKRMFSTGKPQKDVVTVTVQGQTVTFESRRIPIVEGERVTSILVVVRDLTSQRKAQEEISRIEHEKDAVLDAMEEIVIYCDADLKVQWANRAAAQQAGVALEEIIGRPCHGVWHNSEQPCADCPVVRAMETGEPQQTEMMSDDGRIWAVRGYPVHGPDGEVQGAVDVALDITERRSLEENRAQWGAVVESTDDAIIDATVEGRIVRWNPGAERVYGYCSDEVQGTHMSVLAPLERRAELCQIIEDVASGKRLQQHEFVNVTRGGARINVSLTMSPIKGENGRVTGISAIARDITDHVALREQLINLSLVDSLTGLNNRRGFFHLANQQLKVARRTANEALIIFVDVDDMKWINDTFGHKEGDRALIGTAEVLRSTFRESDILGRIGGDEFAVLALEADQDEAAEILERLSRALEQHNEAAGRDYRLSLSRGVVTCPPDNPVPLEKLMAEADSRMYDHKRSKTRVR